MSRLIIIFLIIVPFCAFSQEGTITVKKKEAYTGRWRLSGWAYNLVFPKGTKREKEFWVFGRHGGWAHYVNNRNSDTSSAGGPATTQLYSGEWEWQDDTLVIYVYTAYKQNIENFTWRYKSWYVNNVKKLDRVGLKEKDMFKEKSFILYGIPKAEFNTYNIDINRL